MQGYGLHSNSALFWPPEKERVREPLVILSPRLALGTRENAGVAYQLRRVLGPREGRGEVASSDFCPAFGVGDPREGRGDVVLLICPLFWGPPTTHGMPSNSTLFWGPEKAGLRRPLLILSPRLALGTPENAVVYVAIPPSFRAPEKAGMR